MIYEEWRDIPEFFGQYQISNIGRVRCMIKCNAHPNAPRILSQRPNPKGYLYCHVGGKHRSVHRLVAQSFVTNPDNLPQVNHKDGNKQNNSADNLEWVTNQENQRHAVKNGLRNIEDMTNVTSKAVLQIDKNSGEIIAKHKSMSEAARNIGIFESQISDCCKGKPHCLSAGGFKWRYANEI